MIALRSKYKVKEDWINRDPPANASCTWRAIKLLKPQLRKGMCYLIGSGEKVDVWKDPWVPWLPSFTPKPKSNLTPMHPLLVSYLIDPETQSWRFDVLEEMFDLESIVAISKIVIPMVHRVDILSWIVDSKGTFTVKSAYEVNVKHLWPVNPDPIWKKLWNSKIHERLKTFIWCIGNGVLPTNLNIATRVSRGNPLCPLCLLEEESIPHVFFNCSATKIFLFGSC